VETYGFTRSVSQRRLYRECGVKWYHRYVGGWTLKTKKAQYQFGNIIEQVCGEVIMKAITSPTAASTRFSELWDPYRMDATLTYRQNLTWKTLNDRGKILAQHICVQLPNVIRVDDWYQLQQQLRYRIGEADELCYLDFCGFGRQDASEPWKFGILDFKTADRTEQQTLVEKDEQLTTYQLAVETNFNRKVEWLALFRCIWTTEPKIQVLWTPARTPEEIEKFKAAAIDVDRQIKAGVFHENQSACHAWGGCQYQPLCFPSQKHRLDTELIQDPRKIGGELDTDIEI